VRLSGCGDYRGFCLRCRSRPMPASGAAGYFSFWLAAGFLAAAFLFVGGILLLNCARSGEAAAVSGIGWIMLGVLGAWISAQPLPSNHIVRLIESGRIDLHTPLRWHGTLRDEPTRLPWSYGLEVELAGVDYENSRLAAHGGCD